MVQWTRSEQPPASYTSIEQFEAQVIAQHIDLDDVVAVSFWPPASHKLTVKLQCGVSLWSPNQQQSTALA
ncbi:hypothetical protein ACO22_06379 [Paracoccidioides brasiliensis]|uniref:Uncharacterized protein n=1 Tax=Paracoccidioides brasiliensis TaxID=121759 RepID=A0A1D2J7Q7_PARBR|nr:hypothetical protein ACO22_06379 [Paracoccidioides brasiliensis]